MGQEGPGEGVAPVSPAPRPSYHPLPIFHAGAGTGRGLAPGLPPLRPPEAREFPFQEEGSKGTNGPCVLQGGAQGEQGAGPSSPHAGGGADMFARLKHGADDLIGGARGSAFHGKEDEIRKLMKKKMLREEESQRPVAYITETKQSRRASILIREKERRSSMLDMRGQSPLGLSPVFPQSSARGKRGSTIALAENQKADRRNSIAGLDQAAKARQEAQKISKDKWTRSDKDAKTLHQLVKHIKFFDDFPEEAAIELCKVFRYESIPSGGPICKQGDYGDKFYILFTGKARVYRFEDELDALMTRARLENSMDGKDRRDKEAEPTEEEEVVLMYGERCAEMSPPQSFGEVALLRKDVRTATVMADPGTELMALSSFDFDRIIRQLGNVIFMPERVRQILSIPPGERTRDARFILSHLLCRHKFMHRLSKNMVQDLSSNITLQTAEKGEVVFNPGEEALQFYIILTGSIGIYSDDKEMVKLYGEKGDHEDLEHETLGRRVLMLQQGDVFGDKAIMQIGSLRTAAAVANETTELMVMHQQHFQTVFKPALSRHQKDLNVLSALIQLPINERRPEQLAKMTKILLRVSTFFQNLDQKIQFEVSKVANYRKMGANETVFRQGSEGDTFYIIIQGKVSIYTQEEPQNQKKSEKEGLAKKSILGKLGLDVNAEYGNFITILSSGKSFGEVSLQQGSDYTSTALTMDPTEFLEIKKVDFDRIVRNQENIELERSVKFLRSFSPMQHLPAQRLIRLALAFHEIEAQRGALLLIQDEKVSNEDSLVYVVEKGHVRIARSNPSFDPGTSVKKEMKAKRISGASDYGKAKSSLIPPEYDLASVGPGEVFGEIAPILGVPQPVTAIATTPVRLHTCTVDEFLKNIQLTDEGLLKRMKAFCIEKQKWILHREEVNSQAWERYIAHMDHLKICAKLATHGHQSARESLVESVRKGSLASSPSFREQKIRSATPLVEKRQIRPLNELPEGFSLTDLPKISDSKKETSKIDSLGGLQNGEPVVPLEGTMRSTIRDLKVMIPSDDTEDLHRALAVAKRSLQGSRASTPSLASSPRYNPHLIHKKSPINARIIRKEF